MYEPNSEEVSDLTVIDIDVGNLRAIDSAFERPTPVTIRVDENNHIERVETNGRAPDPPIRDPGQTGSVVTRIATQQGDDTRVAEVFFLEDPSATPPVESQALTKDPAAGRCGIGILLRSWVNSLRG